MKLENATGLALIENLLNAISNSFKLFWLRRSIHANIPCISLRWAVRPEYGNKVLDETVTLPSMPIRV